MKKIILLHLLVFVLGLNFFKAQTNYNRQMAQKSVSSYLSLKNKNYKAISFGECFEQTYPNEIEKRLNTDEKIKYSIVHTYMIGETKMIDVYFHLDKNYKVIGMLTNSEMTSLTDKILKSNNKLDSIMNSLVPR